MKHDSALIDLMTYYIMRLFIFYQIVGQTLKPRNPFLVGILEYLLNSFNSSVKRKCGKQPRFNKFRICVLETFWHCTSQFWFTGPQNAGRLYSSLTAFNISTREKLL